MIGSIARPLNEYPCLRCRKLDIVGLPYSQLPHPWIQPTADQKYLKKNFQKVPKKQNLSFLYVGSYLHSIYIVLTITNNLEMILKYRGGYAWVICKYCVILYKGLEHPQFNSHGRRRTVVLELILWGYQGTTILSFRWDPEWVPKFRNCLNTHIACKTLFYNT